MRPRVGAHGPAYGCGTGTASAELRIPTTCHDAPPTRRHAPSPADVVADATDHDLDRAERFAANLLRWAELLVAAIDERRAGQ